MAEQKAEQKVESVERALAILEAFSDGATNLTLGELAARTQLYRSTILRLAASLERFGYLHRSPDGRFRLGATPHRLGILYQNSFELADVIRPNMRKLTEQTGECSAFYIRERDERILLFWQRAVGTIIVETSDTIRLPLDRGAGGHVLSAYTGGSEPVHAEVRRDGYRVSIGERHADSAAIAAPVFGVDDAFVGALAIVGLRHHFEATNLERFKESVIRIAHETTAMLRREQPRPRVPAL